MNTLVLDNGSWSIKGGWSESGDGVCQIVPNCVTKSRSSKGIFVGDEVDNCRDHSGMVYRRPFHVGHIVNWQVQSIIWDHVMAIGPLKCVPEESRLLVTEPVLELPSIQEAYNEIIFEDYGFAACSRRTGPNLVSYSPSVGGLNPCQLVVDTGYAFTHIVPLYNHVSLNYAIKRIQVGGKVLTNYLKEIISYRQWNMMEETFLVNDVKETTCFVSDNTDRDLGICKQTKRSNSIVLEYVLPDLRKERRGLARPPSALSMGNANEAQQEQVLLMNNERFTVPELLFSPSNIGINQAGITEAIVQAVESTPKELHALFYANIIAVGGNARFPGFGKRIEDDLRKMVSEESMVRVVVPESPDCAALHGGRTLASHPDNAYAFITKQEYAEHGQNLCRRRFLS